jgi:hypothetical protein
MADIPPVLEPLHAMPDKLQTLWQQHEASLDEARLSKVLLILGHLADVELVYGAKLRQRKLAGHSTWQTLIQDARAEHRWLLARASLQTFVSLRHWNVNYCQDIDLKPEHHDILALIGQHDNKRLTQLDALMRAN